MDFDTPAHVVDPTYPGAVEEIINLGDHWEEQYLRDHRQEIVECSNTIHDWFERCYEKLAEAGQVRQEWQQLKTNQQDGEKLAEVESGLLEEIFQQQDNKVRHLFAAAVTPKGLTSFADALSKGCPVRYILQGAPGCGQQQLFKAIIRRAEMGGHTMEIFHYTYDPQEIKLVLLPELGVAILAEEQLVEKNLLPSDRIVPLEEYLQTDDGEPEEEEKLQQSLAELTRQAGENIRQAKAVHDQLEEYYIKAMDFEEVDFTASRVFNKILAIAAERED